MDTEKKLVTLYELSRNLGAILREVYWTKQRIIVTANGKQLVEVKPISKQKKK